MANLEVNSVSSLASRETLKTQNERKELSSVEKAMQEENGSFLFKSNGSVTENLRERVDMLRDQKAGFTMNPNNCSWAGWGEQSWSNR
jgi:hypothetical protein